MAWIHVGTSPMRKRHPVGPYNNELSICPRHPAAKEKARQCRAHGHRAQGTDLAWEEEKRIVRLSRIFRLSLQQPLSGEGKWLQPPLPIPITEPSIAGTAAVRCDVAAPAIPEAKLLRSGLENVYFTRPKL